ncbi:MAG: hypothetical protein AAFO94_12340, partial [Bacteroidota bacterium]
SQFRVNVSRTEDGNFDTIENRTTDFSIDDCDASAAVCLDINPLNIQSYDITDNGAPYTAGFVGCEFDTLISYLYFTIPDQGAEGPYELESWLFNGQSLSLQFQNIDELVAFMQETDPAAGWTLVPATFTIEGVATGNSYGDMMIKQINTGASSPELSLNVQARPRNIALQLSEGVHNLKLTNNANGCTYEFTFNVSCTDDNCPEVYTGPTTLLAADCDGTASLCLDVNPLELSIYEIRDNGNLINVGFMGCKFDTAISYLYFTIPDRGENGPYVLDSWIIDGESFSTEFDDIAELVSFMQTTDPNAGWMLDAATFTIMGKQMGRVYGDMMVRQPETGAASPEISPNIQPLPFATAIGLTVGTHEVEVTNTQTGCVKTVSITVDCEDNEVEGEVVTTTIYVGEVDTVCVDLGAVSDIVSVNNLCETASDGNATIVLIPNTNCAEVTGATVGRDTFCLELCDISGVCDTNTIIVNVLPVRVEADTIREEILVGFVDTICLNSTVLQTDVASIENICPDESGAFVDFVPLEGSSCVAFTGDAIGTEQACVVFCDSLQNCDTTILIVSVIPPTTDTITEIILVDSDTTFCPDTSELAGTITSISNDCPERSGTNAVVTTDAETFCIDVQGLNEGQDTACIVICDDRGLCDTTIYLFDVQAMGLPPIAIDDDTTTVLGTS